jgi:integrase
VLLKLERELGLPKLTFRVIRRTTATLAQKMGTVKDVQGLLRHSRTATTTDVYMRRRSLRACALRVDSIHRELKSEARARMDAHGVDPGTERYSVLSGRSRELGI